MQALRVAEAAELLLDALPRDATKLLAEHIESTWAGAAAVLAAALAVAVAVAVTLAVAGLGGDGGAIVEAGSA